MMIDPLDSLAFTLHANKGAYALLIGSGVSRGAQILTGWEIVLDLSRKLARLRGEDCGDDPEAWYRAQYDEEPNYSKILKQLARSPTERMQLLRSYFEPSGNEEEEGEKLPGDAHKAIAELVARGHVRVIISTNFDRLLERALEAIGITPTVICSPHHAKGALPLQHAQCTILKVNGDYIDSRLKNTPDELASYAPPMRRLIDRVLSEYGLIVCGWSADWDIGLRERILSSPNRRFTTYWTSRGALREQAKDVASFRQAVVLEIGSADVLFPKLADMVRSLEEIQPPHPLSVKTGVAMVKRYLSNHDRHHIQLDDLITAEADRVATELRGSPFDPTGPSPTEEEVITRARRAEAIVEKLIAMTIVGCYWEADRYIRLWCKTVRRLSQFEEQRASHFDTWMGIRSYPALLLFFAAGIGCVASDSYRALKALLTMRVADYLRRDREIVTSLNSDSVNAGSWAKCLPERDNKKTPLSDEIRDVLRQPARACLPDERDYDMVFERLECLIALACAHIEQIAPEKERRFSRPPLGRFAWIAYTRFGRDDATWLRALKREAAEAGSDWGPFKAGMFGGSEEAFDEASKLVNTAIGNCGWW